MALKSFYSFTVAIQQVGLMFHRKHIKKCWFFGIYLNFSDWQRMNLRPIYLHSVSVSCPLKQVLAADRPVSAFLVQAASFLCLCFTGLLPAALRDNSILAPNLHFVCLLWMDSTHYIFTSSVLSLPLTVSHNKKSNGHSIWAALTLTSLQQFCNAIALGKQTYIT